jgi:AmmeMemoRadiSam system protein A
MNKNELSAADKSYLLVLARESIARAVGREPLPEISFSSLSPDLQKVGASFVTLTQNGALRGCIGALEAYQPLVEDVREHAVGAAQEDYRFPPVQPTEVPGIRIEISLLTIPHALEYFDAEDLIQKLHPGVDGVILRDGGRRATFLPQVWEQVPNPEEFLSHLCLKMGTGRDLWRQKNLGVQIYQVEEFHD